MILAAVQLLLRLNTEVSGGRAGCGIAADWRESDGKCATRRAAC